MIDLTTRAVRETRAVSPAATGERGRGNRRRSPFTGPDRRRISPARGPPLWDDCSDAQMDDGAQTEPADWDLAAQPAPDFEVDQRISW